MTNLRWLKKDGQMILQAATLTGIDKYGDQVTDLWQDVPTVSEPRKAREYWVEPGNIECRAWPNDGGPTINFKGTKAPSNIIKVREVLDDPT